MVIYNKNPEVPILLEVQDLIISAFPTNPGISGSGQSRNSILPEILRRIQLRSISWIGDEELWQAQGRQLAHDCRLKTTESVFANRTVVEIFPSEKKNLNISFSPLLMTVFF